MGTAFVRFKNILFNLLSFGVVLSIFLFVKLLVPKTRKRREIRKVAWFGAYGNGNLGDDLIFYSLKRLLRSNKFEISLSIRDFEKAKNYGVKLFVKGEQFYDYWKYLSKIRTSDAVFLGGGGLFEYYYPSKQSFRMIMIYLCPLMIARIFNKPSFVLGVGVNSDRIDNPIIRYVYRSVLSECNQILTRDLKSKRGLEINGVETNIQDVYDPVLSLNFPKQISERREKKKIGLLLWPYFLWPHFYDNSETISEEKKKKHDDFVRRIKILISELESNYEIKFLTFHFSDTLIYKELGVEFEPKADLLSFIKNVSNLDLLVSMRYHGQISAFLSETPVISISVQQKMDALMENYEMEEHNHNIERFDESQVLKQIGEVLKKETHYVDRIRAKNRFVQRTIQEAYTSIKFE